MEILSYGCKRGVRKPVALNGDDQQISRTTAVIGEGKRQIGVN